MAAVLRSLDAAQVKLLAMITVFTPSFADEDNTNAQNLTVKEVVARLSPEQFRVILFCAGTPDWRIAGRSNTVVLKWRRHGNALRMLVHFLACVPDIYFFPREGPLDTALLSVGKRMGLSTAVVSYIVSGGLDRRNIRPTILRNVAQSDVVVGNSRRVSDLIEERTGTCASTIYDGIDRRYYYPPPARNAKDELVVLYAGSFRPWKRVHMVVEQAALWPGVQFRIAGTGDEEHRCRQLAQELGCKNVTFLGHLPQADLGEEMRRADIFFFPSELEGHPQVLGQAAACGLPCVAMNWYRPDFVRDGETGFLADSDAELADRLRLLLISAELRRSMSTAAVEHMRQFDWDRIAAQWAGVFEAITTVKRQHRVQA